MSCFCKKVEIIDFGTLSNLSFKYRIFHENKQFLSSFEMCCFICFHLKVDFSVQWCTAREQVCCDFMLFHWWSRALSGKHQSKNLQEVTGRTSSPAEATRETEHRSAMHSAPSTEV